MKKICSTCKKEFPISNFYRCGTTKSGKIKYACECKDCRKNRELKRYVEIKKDVFDYRKPCKHCGLDKPYLIEFHHKDPNEKEFVVAHWRKKSKEAYLKEIEKCDTLCKNCHAEFHYLNKTIGISYAEYIKQY